MKLSDLQKEISDFIIENKMETSVQVRLLDLMSELGELSKEVLKVTNYGEKEFKKSNDWINEFGDVLFSLICIANSTGVDMEKALYMALDKYKRRIDEKGSAGSNL